MVDLPHCARMNGNINGDECAENIPPPMRWPPGASTELQREPGNISNEEQRVRQMERHLVNDSTAFIDGLYPLLKTNRFAHYIPVLIIYFIGIFLLVVVDPPQDFYGKVPSVIMSIAKNLEMQRLWHFLATTS